MRLDQTAHCFEELPGTLWPAEAIVQPHLHTWAAGVAVLEWEGRDKLCDLLLLLQHCVQSGNLRRESAGLQDDGGTVSTLISIIWEGLVRLGTWRVSF